MAATITESARALGDLVEALAAARDGAGMLSITVGLEHGAPTGGSKPGWEIALRNDLARLRDDGAFGTLLAKRLDGAETRLAEALDPTLTGRGRALFVALESGETAEVMVRPALPTGARVGPVAHVLPLLSVLGEGEPTGLLAASRDVVAVSESELGVVREVERIELEPWVGDWWPEMKGPARANPLRGQQTVSQRDRYERRVAEAYRHTLHEAAATVTSLAKRRGWTRAVLAGDPRTAGPLDEALAGIGVATTVLGVNLEGLREEEASARLEQARAELVAEQALELAGRVEAEAAAGQTGALGLDPVLAALNESRVETLVIVPQAVFPGRVGPGELFEAADGTDGAVDVSDAIVAKALATGASVTPVAGEAAAALERGGGIGALLRW